MHIEMFGNRTHFPLNGWPLVLFLFLFLYFKNGCITWTDCHITHHTSHITHTLWLESAICLRPTDRPFNLAGVSDNRDSNGFARPDLLASSRSFWLASRIWDCLVMSSSAKVCTLVARCSGVSDCSTRLPIRAEMKTTTKNRGWITKKNVFCSCVWLSLKAVSPCREVREKFTDSFAEKCLCFGSFGSLLLQAFEFVCWFFSFFFC